jgi:hypothetical protein
MSSGETNRRKQLIAYINSLQSGLKSVYGSAYSDVFKLTEIKNAIKNGENFTWKGNPYAEQKLDEQLKLLARQTENIIRNGITGSWKLGESDAKDAILEKFGKTKYSDEVNKTLEQANKDHRARAMNAHKFANQKQGGLTLSDRVWNLNGNVKKELEIIIQNRIAEGKSAKSIAADITKYLNEPNKLFRRKKVDIIDKKTGEKTGAKFVLSKAAREYKPGTGVYRSSYKNALRLVITEANRAYRRAEWESYQNNPLIIGYTIQLGNNHTTKDPRTGEAVPLTDICDDLQGDYPKSFLWEGWHPQCRCRMFPTRISDDDLKKRWIARRDNKLDEWKPSNEITEPPKGLYDWIKENENRIAKANKLPYWMIENAKLLPLQLNQINADATI